MITSEILREVKNTFGLSKARINNARANLAAQNIIPAGKYINHSDDILLMLFGVLCAPANFKYQIQYYKDLIKNRDVILTALYKVAKLDKVNHITFGQWYLIVSAPDGKSFTAGNIEDIYLDQSKTVSGDKLLGLIKQFVKY